MRVLVLDVNLFPDRGTVDAAVARLAERNEIRRTSPGQNAGENDWDRVLADVLAADLVITT
jgi:hypothetical protein